MFPAHYLVYLLYYLALRALNGPWPKYLLNGLVLIVVVGVNIFNNILRKVHLIRSLKFYIFKLIIFISIELLSSEKYKILLFKYMHTKLLAFCLPRQCNHEKIQTILIE